MIYEIALIYTLKLKGTIPEASDISDETTHSTIQIQIKEMHVKNNTTTTIRM